MKMGTPVVKLDAIGPHPYLPDRTDTYSVVLNTSGNILYKLKSHRTEYRSMIGNKRINSEKMAEIGTDKEKAIEYLQKRFDGTEWRLIIPEKKQTPEFSSLREKIAWEKEQRMQRYGEFQTWIDQARQAGMEAAEKCNPTPMVVQQHANPLDDNSGVVQEWYVGEGVCGFAWIDVFEANSSFGRWAVKYGPFRSKSYGSGIQYWVSEFGQSMQRKEAFAHAYAEVLREHGIKAYAGSRMD